MARDMAGWCEEHVRGAGATHGRPLDSGCRSTSRRPALAARSGRGLAAAPPPAEPGLLLLADLRRVHRKAAGASLDWELLAQAARALRTPVCRRCPPGVIRRPCVK